MAEPTLQQKNLWAVVAAIKEAVDAPVPVADITGSSNRAMLFTNNFERTDVKGEQKTVIVTSDVPKAVKFGTDHTGTVKSKRIMFVWYKNEAPPPSHPFEIVEPVFKHKGTTFVPVAPKSVDCVKVYFPDSFHSWGSSDLIKDIVRKAGAALVDTAKK